MRARNIKPTNVSYTGRLRSYKLKRVVSFESSLERDMIFLLEYSPKVRSYQEQPITIEYFHDGKKHSYTPDFFVEYDKNFASGIRQKPMIIEVKYRKNLRKNWKQLKPKFQAALRYASDRGWRFKIMTEVEIRTPYLDNIRFLLGYYEHPPEQEHFLKLLQKAKELQNFTAEQLILAATRDVEQRAQMIYGLWYMVAKGNIQTDLSKKLNMQSQLWYHT